MPFFIDAILPLPLKDTYTYAVTKAEYDFIRPGMRVIVPFGKRKMYTAVVLSLHQKAPEAYKPKQIDSLIDENPILSSPQLSFLEWIAQYYQAPIGLVIRAAIPSVMLLESETEILIQEWSSVLPSLSKNAKKLLQLVQPNSALSLSQAQQLMGVKNTIPVIN